ncbi:hypothetical protein DEO72_LG4g501 [Vigna unguiculata]|uniref:Uncharacterized protein n=1 Tax=Vigna unguiculata TaxID=3917 RepID=A0A4D6LMI2_VIGUN|nr:hypothetical protein DEO72_LG4g501 [Vigna unguiculata]
MGIGLRSRDAMAVSYTQLDVYKRQAVSACAKVTWVDVVAAETSEGLGSWLLWKYGDRFAFQRCNGGRARRIAAAGDGGATVKVLSMVHQWWLRQHDNLEKTMCYSNGRVQRWTAMSMAGLASSMAACGAREEVDGSAVIAGVKGGRCGMVREREEEKKLGSPYLLVCGDDRIRNIREQMMLQVDLVRHRAEARLDLGEGFS